MFAATTKEEAKNRLGKVGEFLKKRKKDHVWTWLEENIEEGLTCFSFPEKHRKKIRTVNVVERLNKEIRRRTRVVMVFPNVASCERLITAVLQGIHEEWMSGKTYLDMSLLG